METPSVFRKHGPKLGRGEKDRIFQPLFPVILRSETCQHGGLADSALRDHFPKHMEGQRMDEIYVKNVFYLVHYTQNIIMSTCKQYKHYYDDIFYSLVLSLQIQYVFYIPSTSQFRPAPFPGFISHLWPVASTLEGVILTCCQYHWT